MEEIEYGYILLSDKELADNMGLSEQTIKKYHRSLIEKGYLDIIEINEREIKRLNLTKLSTSKKK